MGEVKVPVDPARVMYAGLDDWNEVEDQIIRRLQLRSAGVGAETETAQPVLDGSRRRRSRILQCISTSTCSIRAHFRPLLFNKPSIPKDAFEGIPQGRDAARPGGAATKRCGRSHRCGRTRYHRAPAWDVLELRDALRKLPLLA